jgi:chromosome segregation ATPase
MSEVLDVSPDVTTAEVAAMSSEELRRAVGRGRLTDELEKEIGLLKRMNRVLMDQVSEVKLELAREKDKKAVSGVAHENGRLEEDPENDELPALRLTNESLLTRQLMLEAQLAEAARYNALVSSELSQTKLELRTVQEHNNRIESKHDLLKLELDQLQNASLSSLQNTSTAKSTASFEAMTKLQEQNGDLIDQVRSLQEKYAKRKDEVTNLRSNVQFLKSKITELTSKLQSNEAVNDEALQRLKEHFAVDALDPSSSAPTAGFGAALSTDLASSREVRKTSVMGILDAEQNDLLEAASTEITRLLASVSSGSPSENSPLSIKEYFNSKLNSLEAMKSLLKPTDPSAPLVTITEHDSVSAPSKLSSSTQITTGPTQMNWHEFDAAFLVLSVMLLQKLSHTHERLSRKRREYSDLQEDFASYKRSQTQTASRSGTGSRKMSAETQQISLQKKLTDLEKSVQSLTASSNEKEARLLELTSHLQQLTSDLETKSTLLDQSNSAQSEAAASLTATQLELSELQKVEADLRLSRSQMEADLTASRSEAAKLSQELASVTSQLHKRSQEADTQSQALATLSADLDNLRAETSHLQNQISHLTRDIADKTALLASQGLQLENNATEKLALEARLNGATLQLSEVSTRFDEISSSHKDITAQLSTLVERLSQSEESLKVNREERQRLTLEVGRLSSDLHAQSDLSSSLEAQLTEKKKECDSVQSAKEATLKELESLKESFSLLHNQHSELLSTFRSQKDKITHLESLNRELEAVIEAKGKEAELAASIAASQLIQVTSEKDNALRLLKNELESSQSAVLSLQEKLEEYGTRIAGLQTVLDTRITEVSTLGSELLTVKKSLSEQIGSYQNLEKAHGELLDVKSKLEESIQNLSKTVESLRGEVEDELSKEAALKAQVDQLSIKAKELDSYQKKLPEIADEALEAEERAVAKWLEFTLNKEKATSSNNPIAALASQLSLGTHSPGSAAMNLSSGMVSRKIVRLADSFRHPSFLASVINLIKKDAFSDQAIKKLEELDDASASEADVLRCLEECLTIGRSHGLRANGVTGPLLLQGNRRTLVDISLEVIRMNIMVRINIRAHPELSLLYVGKDEKSMATKHGERLLLKWVNTFIEDFNQSLPPSTNPRPLITNLGRDLSDGKALGILLAAINPSWSSLADSSGGDLPRRIVKELAQAAFMRIIPPFLDSPLPILRGDETVISILLAQLLEFNTGLSSALAKDTVASTTSSTAYMLSATTPSRNQVRAVSGKHMTESPLKTPSTSKSGATAASASEYTLKSTTPRQLGISSARDLSSTRPDPNQVTVKPVEENRGWKFW